MSIFLENLKNAVDTGEFNSDAAKKILEVNQLADNKIETAETSLEKRLEAVGIKTVTEEEALALNSQYEQKMGELKKQNMANSQIATLIDIEDMVKASISDMMTFVAELESKFTKELATESAYIDLSVKIEDIKSKYSTIINN